MSDKKKFEYDDFTYDDYKESAKVQLANQNLLTHLSNKPSEYTSQWQNQLNDTIDKILNREKFTYDLNGDALYQQYKDKYIQQGKMAMGDAIGQASAMTGGYGNSYAQSIGQQAYQAQLQNLNDIVPELYQMALDKYNMEGQDLYNQYSLLGSADDRDYGRYRDSVADWNTDRDYLTGRYDSERNFDYGQYVDDRNFAYGQYADDKNYAYNEYRNAITDEQWEKEYDLAKKKVVDDTVDTTTGHTGVDKNSVATPTGYNPKSSVTPNDIKKMQAVLGVAQDGKWGPKSTVAAGGLSVEEAYKAWKNGTLKKANDDADLFADFDGGDWEAYFANIRNDDGKSAAEAEMSRLSKAGILPDNMTYYAAIGARGSLGH